MRIILLPYYKRLMLVMETKCRQGLRYELRPRNDGGKTSGATVPFNNHEIFSLFIL